MSCPYIPAQNGRAERKHRHITEMGLALLFHCYAPMHLWVEAFCTAVYTINRLPTLIISNKSPFKMLYGRPPSYETFHVFGCRVYPCLCDYTQHKFKPRSLPCIFLGYSTHHKGFRCLNPATSRVYISRHARFDETCFPYEKNCTPSASSLTYSEFVDFSPKSNPSLHIPPSSHTSSSSNQTPPCRICPTIPSQHTHHPHNDTPLLDPPLSPQSPQNPPSPHAHPPSPQLAQNPPPRTTVFVPPNLHPMQTRAKLGIFKTRYPADLALLGSHGLYSALTAIFEPRGIKTTFKYPHWVKPMHDEMTMLRTNETWDLVPRPPNTNIVGSKWVYRTKFLADGLVDRYKVRLVAQGFSQLPGFDFTHTFSPVIKASTVRNLIPRHYAFLVSTSARCQECISQWLLVKTCIYGAASWVY